VLGETKMRGKADRWSDGGEMVKIWDFT
jgi:hypothetical protein